MQKHQKRAFLLRGLFLKFVGWKTLNFQKKTPKFNLDVFFDVIKLNANLVFNNFAADQFILPSFKLFPLVISRHFCLFSPSLRVMSVESRACCI
jgi:hypothetical protein